MLASPVPTSGNAFGGFIAGSDGLILVTAVLAIDPATGTVDAGAAYLFQAPRSGTTFIDPGSDNPAGGTVETFTATIDWGDGTPPEPGTVTRIKGGPGVLTTGTVNGSHVYNAGGIYTVTVTVTDDDGGPGSDTLQVKVNNLPGLSGKVFDDRDNNGAMDPAESGLHGVTMRLVGTDDRGPVDRTTVTDDAGGYVFKDLRAGTYSVVEVGQPAGLLDGKEAAGALGGTVYNDRDSNVIDAIVVHIDDPDAPGYNFGEIRPSRLQGLVWEDFNNDSEVDFGENAITDVEVRLTGTDDRGNAVDIVLAATDLQGIFESVDLRPGNYTLTETQPAGYAQGKDSLGTVNGIPTGNATVQDQFSNVLLPRRGRTA